MPSVPQRNGGQYAEFSTAGASLNLNVRTGGTSGNSRMLPSDSVDGYAELRQLRIFDGIPNDALSRGMSSGGITWGSLDRDTIIADPWGASGRSGRIYFIARGQFAAGVFDSGELRKRLDEQIAQQKMSAKERERLSALSPTPLARLARKNVALFRKGDLFNTDALRNSDRMPVAFYTVQPAKFACLSHAAVSELASRYSFFEKRVRKAIEVSRQRLASVTGIKQELLDFFVRHGMSSSGRMVRVRQLDRCIDCKQCEDACEERYGAKRLTLGGYQLGMLDFVYTCRSCTDQRCIDPCDFDAITYNSKRREIVINDASCTGCSLCAQTCPYGAIEMIDVENPSDPTFRGAFRRRLEASGALKFGGGTPRLARARRIANKCDHCKNYYDQACISACPTGALVEVSAFDLFRERSPAQARLAQSGYDGRVPRESEELLPLETFTSGINIRDGGMAKVRRGQLFPLILWGVAMAAWVLVCVEIFLRYFAPASSLQYLFLRQDPDLSPEMALAKVGYWAGCTLAIWTGYVGTALMGISAIYPMMRRIAIFRFLASNTMWFDFHMMSGIVGPMFIVQHSAMNLSTWVSAAFWSMVIVVISGVMGRYLYTQVPDLLGGRDLEELEHQRALARLRERHSRAVAVAEALVRDHKDAVRQVAKYSGWRVLWWVMMEDLKESLRKRRYYRVLSSSSVPRSVRRELALRVSRLTMIERSRVLGRHAQVLLHSWKKVHVPFTIILTGISAFHIWWAFQYSM